MVDLTEDRARSSAATVRGAAQSADTESFLDADPLAPARGIMVALLLSVPLWALIGLALWFIL
jgi:hypothetical protein